MALKNSIYNLLKDLINGFLLKPGIEIKKPIINEIEIDIKEILTVKPKPLIKNSKFVRPLSKVGSRIYQPQL